MTAEVLEPAGFAPIRAQLVALGDDLALTRQWHVQPTIFFHFGWWDLAF
jgi:hypothetical protein